MLLLSLSACSVDDRSVRTAMGANMGLDDDSSAQGTAGAGNAQGRPDPLPAESSGAESSGAESSGAESSGSMPPSAAGSDAMQGPSSTATSPAGEATFLVNVVGDGQGSTTVRVAGAEPFECTRGCSVRVALGTQVTVTARLQAYSIVRSWSAPDCGTQPSCTQLVQGDGELRLEVQLKHQVAFATSQTYLPSQLPRAGDAANTECTRLAKAAGFHGTRWVAWLSSSNGTADTSDDVQAIDQFQHGGGWVRADGVPVARSLAALTRGEMLAPILFASSVAAAAYTAWSNTGTDGRLLAPLSPDSGDSLDCNGWTSDDGALSGRVSWPLGMGGPRWDGLYVEGCNEPQGLVCLGDDSDEAVELPALAGRLAFLSEGTFTPGGGVAAADALCQREACAAGLTGGSNCDQAPGTARTFLSYLHTASQRAWERFDLSGPTWSRPDGMQWLATASELARDAAAALVPPAVLLGPRYGLGPGAMWVGEAAGTSTCGDWSSSSGTGATVAYDVPSSAGLGNFLLPNSYVAVLDCSEPLALLCLEQ